MTAPAAGGRERPILFSAAMVRAILSGAKTQTRRVVNMNSPAPIRHIGPLGSENDPSEWGYHFDDKNGHGWCVLGRGHVGRFDGDTWSLRCPYGAPGDRLWVREAFRFPRGTAPVVAGKYALDRHAPTSIGRMAVDAGYAHPWCPAKYESDEHITPDYDEQDWGPWGKLRPGIHMPRWASRLTLRVTDVRVERVQAITEADAVAEGVSASNGAVSAGWARSNFSELWDSINGKRAGCAWKDNPWVWAVSFEVER